MGYISIKQQGVSISLDTDDAMAEAFDAVVLEHLQTNNGAVIEGMGGSITGEEPREGEKIVFWVSASAHIITSYCPTGGDEAKEIAAEMRESLEEDSRIRVAGARVSSH